MPSGDIARMRQEIDRPKVAKRQPGALAISRTSVRKAKLRFFSECHNASEDRGYHVETDSKLIELGVFISASLSIANCLFFRTRSRFSVGSFPSFKSRSQASAHSAYFPIQ